MVDNLGLLRICLGSRRGILTAVGIGCTEDCCLKGLCKIITINLPSYKWDSNSTGIDRPVFYEKALACKIPMRLIRHHQLLHHVASHKVNDMTIPEGNPLARLELPPVPPILYLDQYILYIFLRLLPIDLTVIDRIRKL